MTWPRLAAWQAPPSWFLVSLGVASLLTLGAGFAAQVAEAGTEQPLGPVARSAPSGPWDFPGRLTDADGVYRESLMLQSGADETPTWDALRQATMTGRELKVDLAIPGIAAWITEDKRRGLTRISVPAGDFALQHAAAGRGGDGFDIVVPASALQPGGTDGYFHRITGSYTFAFSRLAGRDVFTLTGGRASTLPWQAPGTTDQIRCLGPEALAQTREQSAQAIRELRHGGYFAAKDAWGASPRVWWAIRTAGLGTWPEAAGDPLDIACQAWDSP